MAALADKEVLPVNFSVAAIDSLAEKALVPAIAFVPEKTLVSSKAFEAVNGCVTAK
jgi:hypothetical protein